LLPLFNYIILTLFGIYQVLRRKFYLLEVAICIAFAIGLTVVLDFTSWKLDENYGFLSYPKSIGPLFMLNGNQTQVYWYTTDMQTSKLSTVYGDVCG
jgi:hypothetical protein